MIIIFIVVIDTNKLVGYITTSCKTHGALGSFMELLATTNLIHISVGLVKSFAGHEVGVMSAPREHGIQPLDAQVYRGPGSLHLGANDATGGQRRASIVASACAHEVHVATAQEGRGQSHRQPWEYLSGVPGKTGLPSERAVSFVFQKRVHFTILGE